MRVCVSAWLLDIPTLKITLWSDITTPHIPQLVLGIVFLARHTHTCPHCILTRPQWIQAWGSSCKDTRSTIHDCVRSACKEKPKLTVSRHRIKSHTLVSRVERGFGFRSLQSLRCRNSLCSKRLRVNNGVTGLSRPASSFSTETQHGHQRQCNSHISHIVVPDRSACSDERVTAWLLDISLDYTKCATLFSIKLGGRIGNRSTSSAFRCSHQSGCHRRSCVCILFSPDTFLSFSVFSSVCLLLFPTPPPSPLIQLIKADGSAFLKATVGLCFLMWDSWVSLLFGFDQLNMLNVTHQILM